MHNVNPIKLNEFNLNILIVEDNLSFGLELEILLVDIGYSVIGIVDNSDTALEKINSTPPDLILMDVDIKGKLTGIELAKKIHHKKIPILFLTSFGHEKNYQEALQTNLIGFLVKPISKFVLRSSIEIAFKKVDDKLEPTSMKAFPVKDYMFFKKRGILHKVKTLEINFIQANDDYTIVHTDSGKFHSTLRLTEMTQVLPTDKFFKTHRSFIINLDKILVVNVQSNWVKIEDSQIPISRINKKAFLQKINRT